MDELAEIDHMLARRPALDAHSGRVAKIAYSLNVNADSDRLLRRAVLIIEALYPNLDEARREYRLTCDCFIKDANMLLERNTGK